MTEIIHSLAALFRPEMAMTEGDTPPPEEGGDSFTTDTEATAEPGAEGGTALPAPPDLPDAAANPLRDWLEELAGISAELAMPEDRPLPGLMPVTAAQAAPVAWPRMSAADEGATEGEADGVADEVAAQTAALVEATASARSDPAETGAVLAARPDATPPQDRPAAPQSRTPLQAQTPGEAPAPQSAAGPPQPTAPAVTGAATEAVGGAAAGAQTSVADRPEGLPQDASADHASRPMGLVGDAPAAAERPNRADLRIAQAAPDAATKAAPAEPAALPMAAPPDSATDEMAGDRTARPDQPPRDQPPGSRQQAEIAADRPPPLPGMRTATEGATARDMQQPVTPEVRVATPPPREAPPEARLPAAISPLPEASAGQPMRTLPLPGQLLPETVPDAPWDSPDAIAAGSRGAGPVPGAIPQGDAGRPEVVAPVLRQIGEALVTTRAGVTEIALAPPELGRLRMVLTGHDRPQLVLWAERPDTLDMLRRNIDLLTAELREAGVEAGLLDFRDGPPPDTPGQRAGTDAAAPQDSGDTRAMAAALTTARSAEAGQPASSRRIDIRL